MIRLVSALILVAFILPLDAQEKVVRSFNNVQSLLSTNPNQYDTAVFTEGFLEPNDGGGQFLRWFSDRSDPVGPEGPYAVPGFNGRWFPLGLTLPPRTNQITDYVAEYWFITNRVDGQPGNGSAGNPFNFALFDPLRLSGSSNITYRFYPGTYPWPGGNVTFGFNVSIIGSGIGSTVFRHERLDLSTGLPAPWNAKSVMLSSTGLVFTVRNLTMDMGGVGAFGTETPAGIVALSARYFVADSVSFTNCPSGPSTNDVDAAVGLHVGGTTGATELINVRNCGFGQFTGTPLVPPVTPTNTFSPWFNFVPVSIVSAGGPSLVENVIVNLSGNAWLPSAFVVAGGTMFNCDAARCLSVVTVPSVAGLPFLNNTSINDGGFNNCLYAFTVNDADPAQMYVTDSEFLLTVGASGSNTYPAFFGVNLPVASGMMQAYNNTVTMNGATNAFRYLVNRTGVNIGSFKFTDNSFRLLQTGSAFDDAGGNYGTTTNLVTQNNWRFRATQPANAAANFFN